MMCTIPILHGFIISFVTDSDVRRWTIKICIPCREKCCYAQYVGLRRHHSTRPIR
jgi:hypothetical protein